MNQIKFSHNWNNKLNCDLYTTIRKSTDEKHDYYKSKIGERFDVILNGNKLNERFLNHVFEDEFMAIPHAVLRLDTGLTVLKAMALFGKFGIKENSTKVLVLWFEVRG